MRKPQVVWNQLTAGTQVKVPHTAIITRSAGSSYTYSSGHARWMYMTATPILLRGSPVHRHQVEKRPVGNLTITAIAEKANYTFDPTNYPIHRKPNPAQEN